MDGVIVEGIRREPKVEGCDMLTRIFTSLTFELGNVKRKLGRDYRPCQIMNTGSFFNLDKSGKFKVARKGSLG